MAIVLFDGECNFCNQNVQFIIKHDPKACFSFASLQSDIGQSLLEKYHLSKSIDSIVVIDQEKAYTASTAALQIAKHLSLPWKIAYLGILIPRPLRNLAYHFIAKYRHKLFKKTACSTPTAQVRKRFLH